MAETVEHRADAIFALPRPPRAARLFGDPPGWRADLEQRGIEVCEHGFDLAVAAPERMREALASGARVVIVDGDRRGADAMRRAGLHATRLLSLPLGRTPAYYVDLGHRRAARYAIRLGGPGPRARRARNLAGAELARAGLLARLAPVTAMGGDVDGPPAHVAAARDLGVSPDMGWSMVVTPGSPVRRNAFLLFAPDGDAPLRALKFSRVPGAAGAFDRERAGLDAAREAGGSAAAWASRRLGVVEVAGRPAALEEAARGVELGTLLRSPVPPRRKWDALDLVVAWLERIARETARPAAALESRLELAGEEAHGHPGLDAATLLSRARTVPAVFRHGELGEDNVFVDRERCTVLDWEWAQPHGLPLADLVFFCCRVCPILDGATTTGEREDHFGRLMAGRSPSSPRLFGWIRRGADVLGIAHAAIGPLVTLGLLEHAGRGRGERERADRTTGHRHERSIPERTLDHWLRDPALGPDWPAFSAA